MVDPQRRQPVSDHDSAKVAESVRGTVPMDFSLPAIAEDNDANDVIGHVYSRASPRDVRSVGPASPVGRPDAASWQRR